MLQSIVSSMIVENSVIYSGYSQSIYNDGITINTNIQSGGRQLVYCNGHSITTTISSGASQYVDGYAYSTIIKNGGEQYVDNDGYVANTKIYGNQEIKGGGVDFYIYKGGSQDVYGTVSNTTIYSGAVQIVYGRDGCASHTIINNGGHQYVRRNASAYDIKVKNGGMLIIGGSANSIKLYFGGILSTYDGATLVNINGLGTSISMGGNSAYIGGESNYLNQIKVTAAHDFKLYIDKNSKLELGSNVKMNNVTLSDNSNLYPNLTVSGTGNQFYYIESIKSKLTYNVNKLTKKDTAIMLKILSEDKPVYMQSIINVAKNQDIGTYKLSKNIDNTKLVTQIYLNDAYQGATITNVSKFNKNGVTYSVTYNNGSTNLKLTAYGDKIYKGTTKADKLTGTTNSDIFYGGKGNDTITGKNGRDVAVYDKTTWGKDVIAKTSGIMTLLFKDLKESDIVQKTSGKNMIITRKGDSKQQITVNNWNDSTHNIVFGSGMTKFETYLSAASPTKSQTTAARNEVWKKAGLASA